MNLAVALATHHKWKVGLLDADIHGPSLPTMMNLHGEPQASEGSHSQAAAVADAAAAADAVKTAVTPATAVQVKCRL